MALRDELLADSPTIYLRKEETSGQHLDETANGNDSTTVQVTGQGTADPGAGHAGSGLGDDFDGTDDFVEVPYSTDFFPGVGSLPFSIFMVGKLDTIDTTFRRLLSWEDASNGWNIHTQSGTNRKLTVERKAAGITVAVGWNSAVIDTVYMVHAVYNGTQLSLYVDGTLVAGPTSSTATMADPGVALNLGRRVYDVTRFFDGELYEFAFFKSALSTTRITAHWNARDDAGVGPQTITVNAAGESESAGTVTPVQPGADQTITVVAAIEQESETRFSAAVEVETAQTVTPVAGAGPQTITVSAATETETAQTVAITLGTVTVTVVAAAETEDSRTVNPSQAGAPQSRPVTVAAETEAAQPIAVDSPTTLTVGAASEVEAVEAVGAVITVTVGTAAELETAQAVSMIPGATTIVVGAAVESETARPVNANQVGAPQTIVVDVATETETVQAVTFTGVSSVNVGAAIETETVQVIGIIPGATSITVGAATETETARPVTPIAGAEYDMVITHGGPTGNWRTGGLKGRWSTGTLSKT